MNEHAMFEAYLARLYTDDAEREHFLRDPHGAARAAGLDPTACDALAAIDRDGLELASESFAHKRARAARQPRTGLGRRLRALRQRWVIGLSGRNST